MSQENMQKIAQIVHDGFVKQDWRRSTTVYGCSYRGNNGTKCAAGMLINDEDYSPSMEGAPAVRDIIVEAINKKLGFELTSDEIAFVYELQRIHDAYGSDYVDKDKFFGALYRHEITINKENV